MAKTVQVLVVDDEPAVRRAIRLLLESSGYAVCDVDSGDAALERLADRGFDLVITDQHMPGMDGWQLADRIRQRLPTQPIIMATALIDKCTISEASQNVDAFLLKPFSPPQLQEVIDQALCRQAVDCKD